jgi:lysophospholipase L1-like esterase
MRSAARSTPGVLALLLLLTALTDGCAPRDGGHDFGSNDPDLLVAVGDSITSGHGLTPYTEYLAATLDKTVRNLGRDGEESPDGAAEAGGILASQKPGYLLVMFGSNDDDVAAPAATVENLRAIVEAARRARTIPVLATIPPTVGDSAYLESGVRTLNAGIRTLAAAEGVALADVEAAFGTRADYFRSDGIHPNDAGIRVIAAAFDVAVRRAGALGRAAVAR